MPKIYVTAMIKSQNQLTNLNGFGMLDDEKKTLSWTDSKKTKYRFNLETKEFIKENQDSILTYQFIKEVATNGLIQLKESQSTLSLTILTNMLEIKNQNVKISYQVLEEVNPQNIIQLEFTWKESIKK